MVAEVFSWKGCDTCGAEDEARGAKYGWPQSEIDSEKQKVAIKNFFGIDKDSFLSKVAKAYLAILGDGRGGIHCENSLEHSSEWSSKTRNDITEDAFDVIITNPPFGKKLAIDSEAILKRYDLGHRWKQAKDGTFEKGVVLDKQPPQILFIERCISLLQARWSHGNCAARNDIRDAEIPLCCRLHKEAGSHQGCGDIAGGYVPARNAC